MRPSFAGSRDARSPPPPEETLESARIDALKQRVFVEPITTANLPDYAAYPYRIVWTLGIFAVAFMIWRIVRTFVEDTLAHVGG